jgi:hypothetical protein
MFNVVIENVNSRFSGVNFGKGFTGFTLYPTQNIYTFILLDQLEGKIWQVQWSTDIKTRAIIPIE